MRSDQPKGLTFLGQVRTALQEDWDVRPDGHKPPIHFFRHKGHGPVKKWQRIYVTCGGHTFAHTYVKCSCGQAFVVVQHGDKELLGCFEASEDVQDAREHFNRTGKELAAEVKTVKVDRKKSKFYFVNDKGAI